MTKSVKDVMRHAKNREKKIEEFSEILDSLESTEDKKKVLWKEIYENALTDRENARMLFTDLYTELQGSAAQHTMLGTTAAKYLERMSKSNDQILRLAELLAKAEQLESQIDPDEIFSKIEEP
jgi:hypothetical protein|tara:strand:+ start:243 stop:611 length:369 start_codon:yes stop_codon:yes gene_type:complete